MAWVESVSPSFRARFDAKATDDIATALERLERTRDRLGELLDETPGDVEVVFHPSPLGLDLARPTLPLARRLDAPAARRYRVGDAAGERIDVLAPKPLLARASRVAGSREMLERAPAALYARVALQRLNPALGQAANPLRSRTREWTWLVEGAAAWLGGQTAHARPAVARRLHEGRTPAYPPARADAWLLGGTLVDLLAREEGPGAVIALAQNRLTTRPPRDVLVDAFGGRLSIHTEAAWRTHLERLGD